MQFNRQHLSKLKRPLGYALFFLAALLVLGIGTLFVFRTQLLRYTVAKVQQRFDARYPARLLIGQAEFSGLASVTLTNIRIQPDDKPALLRADSVYTAVSLSKLVFGRVAFKELNIANALLTPVRKDSTDNFSFLIRKKETNQPRTTTARGTDYGNLINKLIEATFDLIPEKARFRNLKVDFQNNNQHAVALMPFLNIKEGALESVVEYESDSVQTRLVLQGRIDKSGQTLSGKLYAADTSGIWVPYIKSKYNARVQFDTLRFALEDKSYRNGVLNVTGEGAVAGLVLNHGRLALHDVLVRKASARYKVSIGPKWISVDTLSEVRLNEMVFYPQARFEKFPDLNDTTTHKEISFQVTSARTPAQVFFNSLPEGLFETLEGIQATGYLTYRMLFHYDTAQLDSLDFDSDLEGEDLEITEYGQTELTKINRPFEHTVYEYGKPARTFTVGPKNPFYTPITQVSDYLKDAILTAEDYGFYKHKGFHEEALRLAIITNIREKRFARGGSTLTMQLVKNVFLSRNKTLARKFEEALIVWLIENENLVSKYRMFEVYLNIIEWGPYIYGIKDASRFYFAKQPHELTLAEAIFLTRIIPSPKKFRTLFDSYGRLRPFNASYYRMIGGIMRRRGHITEDEYNSLYPQVYLRGRARDLVVTATDVPPDSVLYGVPADTTLRQQPEIDLPDGEVIPITVPAEVEEPKKKFRLWPFGKRNKDKEKK